MNNLSSYRGLVDAKIRASDKDLPVLIWIWVFPHARPRWASLSYGTRSSLYWFHVNDELGMYLIMGWNPLGRSISIFIQTETIWKFKKCLVTTHLNKIRNAPSEIISTHYDLNSKIENWKNFALNTKLKTLGIYQVSTYLIHFFISSL